MIDTMAAIASLPFDVKIELSDRPWRQKLRPSGGGDLLQLTAEITVLRQKLKPQKLKPQKLKPPSAFDLDVFNVEHARSKTVLALPTCIEIARNYLGRKRIIYSRTLENSIGGVDSMGLTMLVIKRSKVVDCSTVFATGCFGG